MKFLSAFSRKKRSGTAVLFDVGANSVAGACVYAAENAPVKVAYATRAPITLHEKDTKEQAMLRSLELVGDGLIKEGAPALSRLMGSGAPEKILISFGAPWQETVLHTEHLREKEPFTVTRSRVADALLSLEHATPGKLLVDRSVVGTILNGYVIADPYGKKANTASIVTLFSAVNEGVLRSVNGVCVRLYHRRDIDNISDTALFYQAIRRAFPHERDALILDATGPEVSVMLVRQGLLVCLHEKPGGKTGTAEWTKGLKEGLAELARNFPLPRTIFLIAGEGDGQKLKEILGKTDLAALWYADQPPAVIPVFSKQLSAFVGLTTDADIRLALMALYYREFLRDA